MGLTNARLTKESQVLVFMSHWIGESLEKLDPSWAWLLTLGILVMVLGMNGVTPDPTATFPAMELSGGCL